MIINNANSNRLRKIKGFTLIELMLVIVIIAIFAAIAMPSYAIYMRRADVAKAQQEMQKIAEQLERHKARNFNYKGFDASYLYKNSSGLVSTKFDSTKQKLQLPLDGSLVKYTISIVDSGDKHNYLIDKDVLGQGWVIVAESNEKYPNYNILLTSTGVRCMNKMDLTKVTYTSCGTKDEGAEQW